MSALAPPGPAGSPVRSLQSMRRNPLGFFRELSAGGRDVAAFRLGPHRAYLLNRPEFAREVLVTRQRDFHKGLALQRARVLLGDGLLTSEGADHLRRRRLVQPAFARARLASYVPAMAAHAEAAADRLAAAGEAEVAAEMMRLALGIVGETLFGAALEDDASEVRAALGDAMEAFDAMLLPLGPVLLRLPLPRTRRLFAARARLDAVVGRLVAERRAAGGGGDDLLGLLVDARADGEGLSDAEVRDEAMTLFLAGHETTAVTLAWTWSLLSGAPDVEAAVHDELDRVLGGRLPEAADVERLPLTRAVVAESLRLYPPAWAIGRRALEAFPSGGYVVPARSIVVVSPWLLHHDPRWWDEAERFAPERFLDEPGGGDGAYLPFGAGARQCLGQGFALLEAAVVLATIARRLRLRLVPGHPVETLPLLTLRPRFGLRMQVEARA